jgi:glycosyltransferase involved in cell wall biosynthesis
MRIVLFTTLFPNAEQPARGIFVWERLRHLRLRHDIDVAVVAPVPYFPTRRGWGRWSTWARVPRREAIDGVPVYHPRYLVTPKIGTALYPLTLAIGAASVVSRLVRDGYQLLDAHYLYPDGAAAALLARRLHLPLVVTGRGSDVTLLPQFRIPRRWVSWTLQRAQGCAAVCTALAQQMRALAGDRVDVLTLRNGVDVQRFAPVPREAARRAFGLPLHRRVIASVGLLAERKGHHLAIDALAQLRQAGDTDTMLFIVGSGPWEARLRRQAQQHQLGDAVQVHGAVSPANMPRVFAAADVLLLASRREGWANVLLESLACGTPVVATALPGTREAVRSPAVGVLFDERSAAGIAAALQTARRTSWDAAAIRAYAAGFSWDDTSDGQMALFGDALRRFPARATTGAAS